MTVARSFRLRAFCYALGMAILLFLPFVILDKGYFVYYGDFNVQQIPFYKLAHEAVRSGDIFWSFYTDLGANFIGSYSFYLLFSPFFWLTLPFPTDWLPFMMAPLLALKTACAALTAYLYLERFVNDRAWAVIGSLLYAFSGWMLFNIFFNHFHEAAVFFPLLLLGAEKLVGDNKKGFFTLMVALNALVNYWFFAGEVIFTILYVIVRMTDKSWRMTLVKFLRLSAEACLGVLMAAVVLIPSVWALDGNTRVGADELLNGWNLWIYWHTQTQPAILQSLFFPPELPARLNFFPDSAAAWASRSAWLPLVGMSGVLAYFFQRRNDWLKKLLALSLLFALVPGLNSLFVLLNHSYYARWFYMPVLLMSMASIRALEDSAGDISHMLRGLKWCVIVWAVFTVMCGLTPIKKDGALLFGLEAYTEMFWAITAAALTCLLIMLILIRLLRAHRRFRALLGTGIALTCVTFGVFYLACGRANTDRGSDKIISAINARELIALPEEPFARMDVYEGPDNFGMFLHMPAIQAFHSIVPPSVMEFYPAVGVKRDVASRPEPEFYALRPLLSVRWLFIEKNLPEQEPMPGYSFHSERIGYNIYENDNFIPMGFAYSEFIDRAQFEDVGIKQRSSLLLKAIVLEDWRAAERHGDIMSRMDIATPLNLSYDILSESAAKLRGQSCYYFARDNRGFTAYSALERDALIFFSVPFDDGWTATVNGQPALIERVNIGFMAVRVPAGAAVIRFDYFTPGLKTGGLISAAALGVFLSYVLLCRILGGKKPGKQTPDMSHALFSGKPVSLGWDEYLSVYRERHARKKRLQNALNEAGADWVRQSLPEEERTLRFEADSAEDIFSGDN